MIRSMTGFGRSERLDGNRRISVEVKSVNHRYLDMNIKMPRKFNQFEGAIRNIIKEYTERGKVDLYVNYEDCSGRDISLKYNSQIAGEYIRYMRQMAEEFDLAGDISVGFLAARPEVFSMDEEPVDEEQLWSLLEPTLREALEAFRDARLKEGQALYSDLMEKLDIIEENVDFITKRSPIIIEEYKDRLKSKVRELLEDSSVDEVRLLMEVTVFADKSCVDEELVRLRSHVSQMREALTTRDSVGRKLDFIAQEMNREANTTLSKTTDLEISGRAIILKTEIEKIREQIQNLE